VLWSEQARRATCCQTAGLATAARTCDHIATMPRVTGRDRCPTPFDNMAVTSTNGDTTGWEGRPGKADVRLRIWRLGFESRPAGQSCSGAISQ
jgi:hypothetical protein